MGTKQYKLTKEQQLQHLREYFRYYADGTPDIYSYGAFKAGITNEEVDNYLRVRSNKLSIKAVRNKFDKIMGGGHTCPCVQVNGEMLTLWYRHDIERFANQMYDGTPTYWD